MDFIYIDAIGGAAGDMILGAFLDGFVEFDYLRGEIEKLSLKNYELSISDTQRHHISAKKFDVHSHEHAHRHLSDIEKIIDASGLSDWIKENAKAVFRKLGEQEAKVHQIPIEKIHFHEVGAVDSIIDIVGTLICLDKLKPKRIYTSELPVSKGYVKAAHGNLPVPAPAAMGLLENYPLIYHAIDGELVTPTAAALITHLSQGQLPQGHSLRISQTGYGAGSKDWKELPNLVRIWKGSISENGDHDSILQIETNIDDMNPEFYPYLQEKLFTAGALDVTLFHGIMKKGRPGILVVILTGNENFDNIRNILLNETSTIGFRFFRVSREKLVRENVQIESPWGKIRVKKVKQNDRIRMLPEFEDCKRIAESRNESLFETFKRIEAFLLEETEN